MAKGQDFSKHQRGIVNRYYQHQDTIRSQRLGDLVSELYLSMDDVKAKRLWESARKALLGAGVEKEKVDALVAKRDIKTLAVLAADVDAGRIKPKEQPRPGVTPTPAAAPAPHPAPVQEDASASGKLDYNALGPDGLPAQEVVKAALKAFRKRLKLTKLNDESKLGRSPLSGGKKSQVMAIIPPAQYPKGVWDELVRQGKLRDTGSGFYELLE
jgi:hypothetical protein